MKLFIDTANVEEIRTASEMGVIAGVVWRVLVYGLGVHGSP